MADFNAKAATPKTAMADTGLFFGAESADAATPSVYTRQAIADGVDAILQTLKRGDAPGYNIAWAGADGSADDNTAAIQAACDTDASVVFVPPGVEFQTRSRIVLREHQTLYGVPRSLLLKNNDLGGSVIKFRPSGPDIAITKHPTDTVDGMCVENIGINMNSDDSVGIAFNHSYGNRIKGVHLDGTYDIGVYLNDTYVCDLEDIITNGSAVKHYCVYVGSSNSVRIVRAHTGSTYAVSSLIPLVGIGINEGSANSIIDCLSQGVDIGIDLRAPRNTVILNQYNEGCALNLRVGSSEVYPRGTSIIGGNWSKPYESHPHYAKRGPLMLIRGSLEMQINNPVFQNSNAVDPNIYPILCDVGANDIKIVAANFHSSKLRNEVFRLGSASPRVTATANYGDYDATEILLRSDGAWGGLHHGLRVNSTGVITAEPWTPTSVDSIDSFWTGDFYIPTLPEPVA